MGVEAAFYFDLASPEAYLAAERALSVLGAPCEWQPILAAALPAGESFEAYRCEREIEVMHCIFSVRPIPGTALFLAEGMDLSRIEAERFVERNSAWLERARERHRLRPRAADLWRIGVDVLWRGEMTEIRAVTEATTLIVDSAASESRPTDPVSQYAAVLRQRVTMAARIDSRIG